MYIYILYHIYIYISYSIPYFQRHTSTWTSDTISDTSIAHSLSNDWHLDPQSCLCFRKDDSATKACFTCQSHHWFLLFPRKMIYKWPVFPTYAAYMFVYRRVISLNSLSFLSDHVNKCFSHTSFCKQHAGVDTQQVPRSFLHFPKNIRFWALTTIQPSRFDILPPRSRKYLSKEHLFLGGFHTQLCLSSP